MHILQTLQLYCLVPFCTDIIDEGLDVVGELTKTTVCVLFEEFILDLGKNELSLLFLLNRLCIPLALFLLSGQEGFLAILDIHFVIVDPE